MIKKQFFWKRILGAILVILALCRPEVVIVEAEGRTRDVRVHRSYRSGELEGLLGITKDAIALQVRLHKTTEEDLECLPSAFFTNLSLEQWTELVRVHTRLTILNGFAKNVNKMAIILSHQETVSLLHPLRDELEHIHPAVFYHLDPWRTLNTGNLSEDQLYSLIHYNPLQAELDAIACQVELLTYVNLVQRKDMEPPTIVETIGLNLNILFEAYDKIDTPKILPEGVLNRLRMILNRCNASKLQVNF